MTDVEWRDRLPDLSRRDLEDAFGVFLASCVLPDLRFFSYSTTDQFHNGYAEFMQSSEAGNCRSYSVQCGSAGRGRVLDFGGSLFVRQKDNVWIRKIFVFYQQWQNQDGVVIYLSHCIDWMDTRFSATDEWNALQRTPNRQIGLSSGKKTTHL